MNYCYQIPKSILPAQNRIIVIGDVHGDWKALMKSLRLSKIIDKKGHWTGGNSHVVQVGDILDRGGRNATHDDEKSEYDIVKFFLKLQKRAKKSGGMVHLLLGNHELMNVMGNFRYVSPMGMTDFEGKRKEMLKPGGKIAKKLACNTNSIVKIGKWVFSHAGVLPEISSRYTIPKFNEKIRNFLLGNTTLNRDSTEVDMFWHRNYSNSPAQCKAVGNALSDYDSKYMVVGHTVQYNGINADCNNSLWRVDVGMSEAFGSQKIKSRKIQVLEIINDGQQINILG